MLTILARLMLLLSLILTTVDITPSPAGIGSQQIQPGHPRLSPITRFGGPIRAAVLHNADALIAEGESLIRVPVVGPDAFTTTERLFLDAGPITDLALGTSYLYALTASHLVTVQLAPFAILQRQAGGGQHLNKSADWLTVAAGQQGVRLFQIKPNGLLNTGIYLSNAGDTQRAVITSQQILASAEAESGVRLVDISDANSPREASILAGLVPATQIAAFDTWVYATQQHYVHIINTFDPNNPDVVSTYAPLNNIQDMVWQDGWLIIADGTDGLKVYQTTSLAEIPRYANSQRGKPAHRVVTDASLNTVLVTYNDGLRLYELSRLPEFSEQWFVPLWDTPTSLAIDTQNKLAYVGLGAGGIAIINYESPLNPIVQGDLPFSGPVQDILLHPIDSTLLYALLGDGRLVTVRINQTDSRQSQVLGDIPVPGSPRRMAVNTSGTTLGVASGRAGIHFFDLGPLSANPRLTFTQPAYAFDTIGVTQIAVTNHGQWVAWDGNRLRVMRLGGNREARLVSEIPLGEINPSFLHLTDNGLWWGQGHQLRGFNFISDTLRQTSRYMAPIAYYDIQALLGQVVLAGDHPDNGLILLDVSDPFNPREQQIIPTDFSPHTVTIDGDDILITDPEAGLVHLRMPISQAAQQTLSPIAVGSLNALNRAGRWLPIDSSQWLLLGEGMSLSLADFHLTQMIDLASRDGLVQGQMIVLVDQDYHLFSIDTHGTVLASNDKTTLAALAMGDGVLWGVGFDGRLQALDQHTLEEVSPPRYVKIDTYPTDLLAVNNEILVGTHTGDLLRLQTPVGPASLDDVLVTRLPDLGGSVVDLRTISGSSDQILATTRVGGVWWLRLAESGSLDVLARYQGQAETLAADLSPDKQWLAIAEGTCGVRILDARQRDLGLRNYAYWPSGTANDVRFVDNQRLAVVADGVPAILQFSPDGRPLQPSSPTNPWPPHRQNMADPPTELRWSSSATTCNSVTYEVLINGQSVGTTTNNHWPIDRPIGRDFQWQVIAIASNGERIKGPVWQVFISTDGWFATPSNFKVKLSQEKSDTSLPWRLLLVMMAVLGIFALMVTGLRVLFQRELA